MTQREARTSPRMPGLGGPGSGGPGLALGTDRKRSRLMKAKQGLWGETSWGSQRWSRPGPAIHNPRARSLAVGRGESSPENAARERSRVRTLRQAFLALQAALPAVPPDTKLSKLDVLVLATSYIAHLTQALGQELPGAAWPPFLRGLRYLHPLKKWPMRSRLYAGALGPSGLDHSTTSAPGQRMWESTISPQVPGEVEFIPPKPVSPTCIGK
ncbi:transcription factor 23 [Sarcophilus harrisii]|uniref:Transcription factor 23 n=1 Tax=Sarcophilus harrisii TaxID=9305 RepID=A0A7N4NU81_SARHA|nr:transcription factor 23 [Sarcophilus harrisii]